MALIDIDDAAARRRLQEIAAASKAALDARVRQAAELSEQAKEAFEREEADLKAALQRKAEVEAAREAARVAAEQQETEDKPKPRPRPSTMSLGAEEFKLDRQARQTAPAEPAPAPAEPAPVEEPAKEAPRPGRTLKLGGRDDEDVPQRDKPVRKRPPRPEADDDMSGRTWLR